MMFSDTYDNVQFTDIDGQHMQFNFHFRTICLMVIINIIISMIMINQGKWTSKVVNPILKEYKMAETGVTNGIRMTERKSEQTLQLKHRVCKQTCCISFLSLVAIIIASDWVSGITNQYIEQKYDYIVYANNTDGYPYSVEHMRNHTNQISTNEQQQPIFEQTTDNEWKPEN